MEHRTIEIVLSILIVIFTLTQASIYWHSTVPVFYPSEINCPPDFNSENKATLNASLGNYGQIPVLLSNICLSDNIECNISYNGVPEPEGFESRTHKTRPFPPIKQESEQTKIQFHLKIKNDSLNEADLSVDFWFGHPLLLVNWHVGHLPRFCEYEKIDGIFVLKKGIEGEHSGYANQITKSFMILIVTLIVALLIFYFKYWG